MSIQFFTGFPEKMEVTPIPAIFLTAIMPDIDDIVELKIVLHIFNLLSRKRGFPRFVTLSELLNDAILIQGISGDNLATVGMTIKRALNLAVDHNILLRVKLNRGNDCEDIYFINSDSEKRTADKIMHGEIKLAGLTPSKADAVRTVKLPDIFTLYEQNIGILTPIIAEELQEAEKRYPWDWIESAFKEAVSLNKRNWKYIRRILERWATEGKNNGAFGRNTKKEVDPYKYVKGRHEQSTQQ